MFVDESRYLLYRPDGRERVTDMLAYYHDNCMLECDRSGGGGLMACAGISKGHRNLIDGSLTAQCYVDVILRPVIVPFARQYNVTFQQDTDRAHAARLIMGFLHKKKKKKSWIFEFGDAHSNQLRFNHNVPRSNRKGKLFPSPIFIL